MMGGTALARLEGLSTSLTVRQQLAVLAAVRDSIRVGTGIGDLPGTLERVVSAARSVDDSITLPQVEAFLSELYVLPHPPINGEMHPERRGGSPGVASPLEDDEEGEGEAGEHGEGGEEEGAREDADDEDASDGREDEDSPEEEKRTETSGKRKSPSRSTTRKRHPPEGAAGSEVSPSKRPRRTSSRR